MYPLGTLKVVWPQGKGDRVSSEMFATKDLEKAVALGEQKGGYLVMKLISYKGNRYQWQILPYGNYKEYMAGISLNKTLDNRFYISPGGQTFTDKETYILQLVRLADVFLIGPFLIYVSTMKQLNPTIRAILFLIGIGTIVYNGRNYIKTMK